MLPDCLRAYHQPAVEWPSYNMYWSAGYKYLPYPQGQRMKQLLWVPQAYHIYTLAKGPGVHPQKPLRVSFHLKSGILQPYLPDCARRPEYHSHALENDWPPD